MTGKEIIKKLEQLEDKYVFWYGDLDEEVFGTVEEVDAVGGCEGGGEYSYRVMHFVDHNVYIRLEGFYSSYNGTDLDDCDYELVTPKQKTITVYE